jgi:exopolysaccharide biosynthesis polyprenyl glycosylphosphotransferase
LRAAGSSGMSAVLSRTRAQRNARLRLAQLGGLLILGDAIGGVIAALGGPMLWALIDPAFTPTAGMPTWNAAFPFVWVALVWVFGGGDLTSPRFARRSVAAIAQAFVATVIVVLGTFYLVPFFLPRASTLVSLPVAAAATLAFRLLYLRVIASTVVERRVLVLGTDLAARRVAHAMIALRQVVSYRVVAFVDAGSAHTGPLIGIPVVSAPDDLWSVVRDLDVDLLVVGHTRALPADMLVELVRCIEQDVEALPATSLYEQLTGRVMVSALEADWYARLPTQASGAYMLVKSTLDVLVAALLISLLVPVLICVAGAILTDSGRPLLHRQIRVGRRGEPFVLHKFRSMRVDAEQSGPVWALPNDPRLTRVGRVLRRFRLDELPQLWDVLRGEMSLVGPRPERPEFVARLVERAPLYAARAIVKPGITGWAQVQYPYAATLEESVAKLEYDLYYIRHFGPLLDMSISLRTASIILGFSRPEFADHPELVSGP